MVGFLLIRFFLGQLGPERFGVWVLVGSLFRYRGIFSMGLNTAVNRYVPMYLAQNDRYGIQRTIGTSLAFYWVMLLLCLLATVVLYHFLGQWFSLPQDLVPQGKTAVLIVGIGFAAIMPLQLATAVLSGLQRYDLVNVHVIVVMVVRTVALVGLLLHGHGIVAMAWVFSMSEILVRVMHWFHARRMLAGISFCGKGIDLPFLRQMLAYGINSFLYTTGAIIIVKATDLIIAASPLGMEAVSHFSIAAAAILLLTQLVQAFTRAIMPAVSDLHARNDAIRLREMAVLMRKYSLFIVIPAVGFLVILGESFLRIWIGEKIGDPEVLKTMATVLTLLAIGHGVRLAQHSNYLVLVGRGEHRIFGKLTAWTTVLVVVISVLAVFKWQGGLRSLAWAHCLPLVVLSGIILPIYFGKKMDISLKQSVQEVWQPALLGTIPALLLWIVFYRWTPPDTWWQLLMIMGGGMVTIVVGAALFGLNQKERQRFYALLFPGR